MKMLIAILLASVLSLAAFAQSQDQTSGQGTQSTQGSQTQTDTRNNSGKSMSGTVGHDATTFKNDANNKKYKVDNPDTLKGKEDQHVAMIVAVDPDTNTIHIIQVEPQQ